MLCNIARCWPSKGSLKHSFSQAPGRAEKRGGGEGARNRPLLPHTFSGAMKPLCSLCSTRHESWQAHVFATNAVPNVVPVATNKPIDATNEVVVLATNSRTKNRRDRESYNAYQREYMRRRRAERAGAV